MFNFINTKANAFGIDLSDLSIKIAGLKKRGRALTLASWNRLDFAEGLIENGEIKKEENLIEIIKKAVSETNGEKLKTKYCNVSLPETISFVQTVKIPKMEEKEVAEAIKWEIEAHVPLALDEIYYDWQIINQPFSRDAKGLEVLIGVLPKKTVDPYLNVLKKAGLKPISFEIESIAISRALIKNNFTPQPILIADLGATRTGLLIFFGKSIYFTSSLPFSNSGLVEILSKKLNISLEKAKQIKMKVGLDLKNHDSKVFLALEPALGELVEKIKGYIDFFQEHFFKEKINACAIGEIIICGGGSQMTGFNSYLQEKLKIKTTLGDPFINIRNEQSEEETDELGNDSLAFTTALGLALRDYYDRA